MPPRRPPPPHPVLAYIPKPLRDLWSFIGFAIGQFYADNLNLAAGALTYTTLLALVPLLVITFAILSGFPAFDVARQRMENLFFEFLVPEAGADVASYLTQFSGNASNLTAVGVIGLAITAIMLLSTIEWTLNRVWRVERPRGLGVRLLIFWTILTFGPLLLGASFALTNSSLGKLAFWAQTGVSPSQQQPVWSQVVSGLVGVVVAILICTLLFKLVPARRVRFRDALIGGTISGVAFKLLSLSFNAFLTSGSTYQTIYGAVAVFPIFLLWIYASWTVVIYGAVVAACFPDWWKTRNAVPADDLTPGERLAVAMAILGTLLDQSKQGGPVTIDTLEDAAPIQARDDVLEKLHESNFVVATGNEDVYLARDLHVTTVAELTRALDLSLSTPSRHSGEGDTSRSRAFASIGHRTGRLPILLARVVEAETRILDQSIADVLEGVELSAPAVVTFDKEAR